MQQYSYPTYSQYQYQSATQQYSYSPQYTTPKSGLSIDWWAIIIPLLITLIPIFKSDKKHSVPPSKSRALNPSYEPPKTQTSGNHDSASPEFKVNTQKLNAEIDKVIKCIGISDEANIEHIKALLEQKRTKDAIMAIAKQLSLDNLDITVIRKKIQKKDKNNPGHFVLADVNVSDVGVYGSSHFIMRPCRINIYSGSEDNQDTFITVIAHEFCHIVLHSVKVPEKDTNDEERLTDLAVIFSGFSDVYRRGRKNLIDDATIGYLSDGEASLACAAYDSKLDEAKSFRTKLQEEYDEIMTKNSDKIRFINMVTRFLKNKHQKLNPEDVSKIGICVSQIDKRQALEIVDSVRNIKSSLNSKRHKIDRSAKEKIKLLEQTLNSITIPDYEYVAILGKYV